MRSTITHSVRNRFLNLQSLLLLSALLHTLFILSKLHIFGKHTAPLAPPIELTQLSPDEIAKLLSKPQSTTKPTPATPPKSKVQEIAETEKLNNDKLDPNAQFLSDKNQTAEKQTRAAQTDDFRQKVGDGIDSGTKSTTINKPTATESTAKPANPSNSSESWDADQAEEMPIAREDTANGVKRDWKTLNLKDLGLGGNGLSAATDDSLKGVDTGERTILSTREFKYFSYYHRVKELLRQHWKPNVERKLTRIYEKGNQVKDDELVTRLQVLLSPDGKIAKISKVSSSGVEEIDSAAVEAFNLASPFPNPPKGMLDADGFVRLNWDFILKTEAAPRIQFSNAGRPMP